VKKSNCLLKLYDRGNDIIFLYVINIRINITIKIFDSLIYAIVDDGFILFLSGEEIRIRLTIVFCWGM
jgi:hypothetical protein